MRSEKNGTKWIRQRYCNDNVSLLFTTNNNGIFTSMAQGMCGGGGFAWTGLQADWTVSPDTCLGWTDQNPSNFGIYGNAAIAYPLFINVSSLNCGGAQGQPICVEQ